MKPGKNSILSFLILLELILGGGSANAWEWKGKCGISKSSVTTCIFIKGDAAMNGENGTRYTYSPPSGDRFQRFVPDSAAGSICESSGFMRKNNGPWFEINTYCEERYIIHSLPTGNSMLVEIYETP
jgi:hypothetical protein